MAPPKPSAYMEFVQDWRRQRNLQNVDIRVVSREAGRYWNVSFYPNNSNINTQAQIGGRMQSWQLLENAGDAEMYPFTDWRSRSYFRDELSKAEKAAYAEKARNFKPQAEKRRTKVKMNCLGQSLEEVERMRQQREEEELMIESDIKRTVRTKTESGTLATSDFIFISGVYFYRTMEEVYVPAEIALAEFSLKSGVQRIFQTHVNPGCVQIGYLADAKHHAETTHMLPLPPQAKGSKNMHDIYKSICLFVEQNTAGKKVPLYTDANCKDMVKSMLKYLQSKSGSDDYMGKEFPIYPIQSLFFYMKKASNPFDEVSKYITDDCFDRDRFEYELNIACEYHEECDRTKYCPQSCVTRWGYTFADYLCKDLEIPLIRGRNCPRKTNVDCIVELPSVSELSEELSQITFSTTTCEESESSGDTVVNSFHGEEGNDEKQVLETGAAVTASLTYVKDAKHTMVATTKTYTTFELYELKKTNVGAATTVQLPESTQKKSSSAFKLAPRNPNMDYNFAKDSSLGSLDQSSVLGVSICSGVSLGRGRRFQNNTSLGVQKVPELKNVYF